MGGQSKEKGGGSSRSRELLAVEHAEQDEDAPRTCAGHLAHFGFLSSLPPLLYFATSLNVNMHPSPRAHLPPSNSPQLAHRRREEKEGGRADRQTAVLRPSSPERK
jgi:hypothetical protein